MKLRDVPKPVDHHGAEFLREGGSRTNYVHRARSKVSAVPRHSEIKDATARTICQDFEIPPP